MKRLVLAMVVATMVFSVLAMGCGDSMTRSSGPSPACPRPVPLVGAQRSAHDRYRETMYRRVCDADIIGFKDDVDAVFLEEHPTHLSPWYNR